MISRRSTGSPTRARVTWVSKVTDSRAQVPRSFEKLSVQNELSHKFTDKDIMSFLRVFVQQFIVEPGFEGHVLTM